MPREEQPHPPGDPLGRVYTPAWLARALVSIASPYFGEDGPGAVLDPSMGGGALLRAAREQWKTARTIGVDIDPKAAGFGVADTGIEGDWPTIARWWKRLPTHQVLVEQERVDDEGRIPLVLSNPPFGEHVGIAVTIEHMMRTIDIGRHVFAIVPLPYVAGEQFDVVWRYKRPAVIHRIVGRPWPDRLREACVFEWDVSRDGPTLIADIREP